MIKGIPFVIVLVIVTIVIIAFAKNKNLFIPISDKTRNWFKSNYPVIAISSESSYHFNEGYPPKILLPSPTYRAYLPTLANYCQCFYVDSINGSDNNTGISPDQPWKTLSKLNHQILPTSSTVYLKRGSKWKGTLIISESGKPEQPITFTTYGEGLAPIITNPGSETNQTIGVDIQGSWIIIDGLQINDAVVGIQVGDQSNHDVIRNNEIYSTGIGIVLLGQYNLVTRNYIHDLHMVVNTPGGYDDYGALGVDIINANNEISYNQFRNCESPSYDFGMDGGAVEIYQVGDNSYIHHNSSFNSEGFMEVSSDGSGSAINVLISYNLIMNSTGLNAIHISDGSGTHIANFRVQNNTFVDLRSHDPLIGGIIWFGGTPAKDAYIFQNNIIYIKDYWWVATDIAGTTHDHNLYYFTNANTKLGFTLNTGELFADPMFIDLQAFNLHLQASSPAINNGIDLGFTLDFDQNLVPFGYMPDMGAYEYQGK